MTAMYLEHYLDSLESLPVELSRNFSLMRELDLQAQVRAVLIWFIVVVASHFIAWTSYRQTTSLFSLIQDILSQIDDSTDEYMRSSKYLTPMEKTKRVGDISKQFTKCKEYGDDKVSLAMQVRILVIWIWVGKETVLSEIPHKIEIIMYHCNCSSFSDRPTIWWTNTSERSAKEPCNRVWLSIDWIVPL